MATYRPSYRRALTIPLVLAVIFIAVGLILGQTLGSHQRLVNQQNECRAKQVTVSTASVKPATTQHASFEVITIRPHKGISCTLTGYPTLVTHSLSSIVVTHLGPRFGLTTVTITATPTTPAELLVSPAVTPYGLRLPGTNGLLVIDPGAKLSTAHYELTPIFASKDIKTIQSLADTDLSVS
jgi:hypothetical protein